MKRLLLFILFYLLSFSIFHFQPSTSYADEGWVINSFDSQIKIQTDGKVRIEETIAVDFGSLQKHGIYRDIPYAYQDNGNTKTYTKIDVNSVAQNSQNAKYQVSKNGSYLRVKIGNPDKAISGKQTYVINYDAIGVLRSFDTYDELYWNVTGNYWAVPIETASATVTLPGDQVLKQDCFQGVYGSTQKCKSSSSSQSAVFTSFNGLASGEGLTLITGYTKGLVPILTVTAPKTFKDQLTEPLTIMAFFGTLFIGSGAIFYLWYTKGRDFWFRRKDLFDPHAKEETMPIGAHETIVVEYSPPENLRPAEIGTLIYQRANTRDVVATIINLAARGYLTITEEPKKWAFGKTDYILSKLDKDKKGLLPYEAYLLDQLFNGGKIIKISSLKKTFYDELAEVKKKLYQDVVDKKLFTKNPDTARSIYLVVGIFAAIAGFILTTVGAGNTIAFVSAFGVAVLVNGILLIIFSGLMPRRSAYGHELYRRVRGYQLFISTAEKYRQRFFEDKNLFNEVLPYAITLGLVDKFAKAMKDIGLKPTQTSAAWYYGTAPFAFDSFASSMNDFSNNVGHAIAQTPSSSSGFSGGGSGGGFGGGGGGSW